MGNKWHVGVRRTGPNTKTESPGLSLANKTWGGSFLGRVNHVWVGYSGCSGGV